MKGLWCLIDVRYAEVMKEFEDLILFLMVLPNYLSSHWLTSLFCSDTQQSILYNNMQIDQNVELPNNRSL